MSHSFVSVSLVAGLIWLGIGDFLLRPCSAAKAPMTTATTASGLRRRQASGSVISRAMGTYTHSEPVR